MSTPSPAAAGQFFREWTQPRRSVSARGDDADWSCRRPYPLSRPRGSRGPRSLVDMTIAVVANNIGDVAGGYLDVFPVRLLSRIWRFLEARGVCLHAWKLFSKLLLREQVEKTLALFRFRQHICHPTDELRCYTQPMMSLSTDFITHLVISGGCGFSASQMLCLADVKNLGVLELIRPAGEVGAIFPHVSDRLIRGWTEMEDPFPLLRILRIWGDQDTTQESLRWVSKFPSLALYDVLASPDDWPNPLGHAEDAGWKLADPVPGLEDSLLWYLMLFAPLEETRNSRLPALARAVDSDLISSCNDPPRAVDFVVHGQAPGLVDRLADSAELNQPGRGPKVQPLDARFCHGVAFETWAFWLYSIIGQVSDDSDMRCRGIQPGVQAVTGSLVLPSKPLACLFLGHPSRGGISARPWCVGRGLFAARRYTFTRPGGVRGKPGTRAPTSRKTRPIPAVPERPEPSLRRQKRRRRLGDVLQSLSK